MIAASLLIASGCAFVAGICVAEKEFTLAAVNVFCALANLYIIFNP